MEARFMSKVRVSPDGCWEWLAAKTSTGYGSFKAGGRSHMAHRYAYEARRGPIPAGLVIDHLCRNRACVNPDHLEVVTQRENLLRADGLVASEVARTHCPQGHPYSGENVYIDSGSRRCRTCSREKSRRRYRPAEGGLNSEARRNAYAARKKASA